MQVLENERLIETQSRAEGFACRCRRKVTEDQRCRITRKKPQRQEDERSQNDDDRDGAGNPPQERIQHAEDSESTRRLRQDNESYRGWSKERKLRARE